MTFEVTWATEPIADGWKFLSDIRTPHQL